MFFPTSFKIQPYPTQHVLKERKKERKLKIHTKHFNAKTLSMAFSQPVLPDTEVTSHVGHGALEMGLVRTEMCDKYEIHPRS